MQTVLVASAVAICAASGLAQQPVGQAPTRFPLSPSLRDAGQSVTGAFEGWFKNTDGTYSLLVGYFSRNLKEVLDVPVGPNNRIEPGGPDQGQPTHFTPGRQFGIFVVKVPADFGAKKLSWTLTTNGQTNVITMHLDPNWVVEPYRDAGGGNTPPVLKFEPSGKSFTGPPREVAVSYTAKPGEPLPLKVWPSDQAPRAAIREGRADQPAAAAGGGRGRGGLSLTWSHYRGAGEVTFANTKPALDPTDGSASTTATFTTAGEYVLRLQANDQSGDGGGGFQCCWTNVHVKVAVK
jgi:hypothetical protein